MAWFTTPFSFLEEKMTDNQINEIIDILNEQRKLIKENTVCTFLGNEYAIIIGLKSSKVMQNMVRYYATEANHIVVDTKIFIRKDKSILERDDISNN